MLCLRRAFPALRLHPAHSNSYPTNDRQIAQGVEISLPPPSILGDRPFRIPPVSSTSTHCTGHRPRIAKSTSIEHTRGINRTDRAAIRIALTPSRAQKYRPGSWRRGPSIRVPTRSVALTRALLQIPPSPLLLYIRVPRI